MSKVCSTCKKEKELSEFGNNSRTKDGKSYKCHDCEIDYFREWRKNNPDNVRKNQSTTFQTRKDNGKVSAYWKQKRNNDPHWRLRRNLASRVWETVAGNVKSATTMKLVGCSVQDLRKHLESQFTEGMSWDNYGKNKAKQNNYPDWWDIDHKKACSKFDLSIPEQQAICFHFTNLQPLWHIDNIRKGGSNRE